MTKKKHNVNLTIVGHLTELRRRIIISGLALIIFSLVGYNFSEIVVKDIIGRAPNMEFIFISPSELMMSYIRIAVFCGFVISSPIILLQTWLFIVPGLEEKHKRYIVIALVMGGGFFIVGSIFAYLVVLPVIIKFFAGFQLPEIQSAISFGNYLDFILKIIISFGIIFEMPIVMFLLSRMGILKPEFYIKNRKYMILIIFILAAILTPPDVISQIMMALPMLILYEVGIILAKLGRKRKGVVSEI